MGQYSVGKHKHSKSGVKNKNNISTFVHQLYATVLDFVY